MLTFQEIILRLQNTGKSRDADWQPTVKKWGPNDESGHDSACFGSGIVECGLCGTLFRPDDGRMGIILTGCRCTRSFRSSSSPIRRSTGALPLQFGGLGHSREEHDIRFVEDNWESRRWVPGGWLGGLARRHGDYAVYVLQQAGGVDLEIPRWRSPTGWSASPCTCRASSRSGIWPGMSITPMERSSLTRRSTTPLRVRTRGDRELRRCIAFSRRGAALSGSEPGGSGAGLYSALLPCLQSAGLPRGGRGDRARQLLQTHAHADPRVAETYLGQRERAAYPWKDRPGLRHPRQHRLSPCICPSVR